MGDLSIHDWDEAGHVVKNKHTKFEQDRSIEKKIIFFFPGGEGLSIRDWDEAGNVVKNKHTKF